MKIKSLIKILLTLTLVFGFLQHGLKTLNGQWQVIV